MCDSIPDRVRRIVIGYIDGGGNHIGIRPSTHKIVTEIKAIKFVQSLAMFLFITEVIT